MAGNIKGITIEFDGDTSKLDKALREIKSETSATAKELKNVNNALKFNPRNVELLKQKAQLLKEQISQTSEKLKILKQQQAAMDAANVNKQSAEYRNLQREIIETESKLKHYNSEARKIAAAISPLGQFSARMRDVGASLTSAAHAMRGFSMAGAAVAGTITTLAVKSGQWADNVETMSKKYSLATDDLQMYSAAAKLVDVDVNTIAKSHIKLEKNMQSAAQGSKNQAAAFETLGVEYKNADGSLRDSDETWQDVISALGKMENETERDAIAMQLMGKSAAELNPLIEDGGEKYAQFAETMEKYGLDFVDEETLKRANEFNDDLDEMKSLGLIAFQNLGASLAAYLEPALEKVVELVGKFANWISNLDPRILTVIGIIGGLVAAIAPLLLIAGKFAFAISSISGLLATLGTSFGAVAAAALPWIAGIAAAIAIGMLLYKHWDQIKAKAAELWAHLQSIFGAIRDFIIGVWNGIKAVAEAVWSALMAIIQARIDAIKAVIIAAVSVIQSVWDKLSGIPAKVSAIFQRIKSAITTPIQSARDLIKGAIDKIKAFFPLNLGKILNLKIPHISITGGKAPWGIAGKGELPKFNVDWYAKGAIFTRPTILAGVGEAGAEAVLPLDKLWMQMNSMADSIVNGVVAAGSMGAAGAPINITLYAFPSGPEMERWIVDAYDNGKRRFG